MHGLKDKVGEIVKLCAIPPSHHP